MVVDQTTWNLVASIRAAGRCVHSGLALFSAQDALNDTIWSYTQLKAEEVCLRTFTMRLTLRRVSKVTTVSKHCARTALLLAQEPCS